MKTTISSHEKDTNYKENVQRALKEKTDSINGYKVKAHCGEKMTSKSCLIIL